MVSGQEKSKLEGHTGFVESVAISPDGMTIVSRDTGGGER